MITVSEQFRQALLKRRLPPENLTIKLTKGSQTWDITPYVIHESLQNISKQIEEKINAFASGDATFTIYADDDIWDFLMGDNERIEVEIKSGFSFEQITNFTGYVDKLNTSRSSTGEIEIRAYPVDRLLKEDLVGDVPILDWGNMNPILAKKIVETIYDYEGLTDQDIHITPLDSDYHIDNYVDILGYAIDLGDRRPFLTRIDDNSFFIIVYSGSYNLYIFTFNSDKSDWTLTECSLPSTILDFRVIKAERWRNRWVFVFGQDELITFYNDGGLPVEDYDVVCKRILFYDSAGILKDDLATNNFTHDGYAYYPRAECVSAILDVYDSYSYDYFQIGYNGSIGTNPKTSVRACINRAFNIHSPGVLYSMTSRVASCMKKGCGAASLGSTPRFVWTMLDSTVYTTNICFRIWRLDTGAVATKYTSMSTADIANMQGIGKYVFYGDVRDGLDAVTMTISSILPTGYGSCKDSSTPQNTETYRQVMSAFNPTTKQWMAYCWKNDNTYIAITSPFDPVRPMEHRRTNGSMYTWNYSYLQGLHYICAYNGGLFFAGIPRFLYYYLGCPLTFVGKVLFPFVDQPDDNEENLWDLLANIAVTYNCIFYIRNFTHAAFLSRQYVGSEYSMSQQEAEREYELTKDDPYTVRVSYGVDHEYVYGDHAKEIAINTGMVYDNEHIAEIVAKNIYNFFATNQDLATFRSYFHIHLEPYDRINFWGMMTAYLMSIEKEGQETQLEVRGVKNGG